MDSSDLLERVVAYLSLMPGDVKVKNPLGDGTDGYVWRTSHDTAVKAFMEEHSYINERDAYLRLAEYGLTKKIGEFWVPEMIGYHDELQVVEMDIIQDRPYVIDFAKVRINFGPEFSEETLEEHEKQGWERFEENWPRVKLLLAHLESIGIYYLDPQLGNISFSAAK